MSEPTTTIKIRGKVEDAVTATQIDLEVQLPLRPLAFALAALLRPITVVDDPIDGVVSRWAEKMAGEATQEEKE